MKKYLSLLMAVLMLMGVMTISAGAVEEVSQAEANKYMDLWIVDKDGNDGAAEMKDETLALGTQSPFHDYLNANYFDVKTVHVNPKSQLLFKNLGGKVDGFITVNGYKAKKTTFNEAMASGRFNTESSIDTPIKDKNAPLYIYDELGYFLNKDGGWTSYGEGGETSDFYYLKNGQNLRVGYPGGSDGDLYIINTMISFDKNYPYEAVYWLTFYIVFDESVPLLSGETIIDGGNFTDIHSSDYYFQPIYWAVEKGITTGTSATTFSPNATCTNAHILTFLWRAYGSQEPTIANPFSNVKESDYYYKAALWAAEKGLISGKTFKANDACTRGSTVKFMWTLAGKPTGNTADFSDIPAGSDMYNAVAWAYKEGITSGTSATTFSPDNTCTRGQIVTFLYRGLADK